MTLQQPQEGSTAALLLKRLYSSRSLFVLVVMMVAGISLIAAPSLLEFSPTAQSISLAVGTSLLASSLFSGVHIFFTNQEFIELFSVRMEALIRRETQEIVGEFVRTNPAYLPVAGYEATSTEQSSFNRDLMTSLRSSQSYRFQGLTGYFVPLRIEAAHTTLGQLRVVLADINDQAALRLRVTREIALGNRKDYASVVEDTRRKATQCLVGIMEVRARCQSIEVLWTADPSSDRYEIFDGDVYITTFDGGHPVESTYPSSIRFSNSSLMYNIATRRFDLQFQRTGARVVTIRPEDDKVDILSRLAAFGIALDEHQYQQAATEFWSDVKNYSQQLEGPQT